MNEQENIKDSAIPRRPILQDAGASMLGGLTASEVLTPPLEAHGSSATSVEARNRGPLEARLRGIQHFGLTVQNMDRAFAFYSEVLGGAEVMRDGDFHGESIHNTLLADQEIEARVKSIP